MTKNVLPAAILGGLLVLLLHVAPAQAVTRTWVSGAGANTGTCIRSAPCLTFDYAITQTNAGGLIICLDPGGFGQVVIDKSITIDCTGTFGGILVGSGNGIEVTAAATDTVTIRGLSIEGLGTGQYGVYATNGTTVHVENCKIFRFRGNNTSAGINYQSASGLGNLHVSDTSVNDNSIAGIWIRPSGTGSVNASINRVQAKNNNNVGILVDGRFSTGVAVNANVRESVAADNGSHGISGLSETGKAGVTVLVDRTTSSFNIGSGVLVQGAAASGAGSARARIGDSVITQNVTGVSALNAGVIRTYKTNEINDNLIDGTPIANQDVLN